MMGTSILLIILLYLGLFSRKKNFLLIEIFPSGIPFLLVTNFYLYKKKTSLYLSFSLGFRAAQVGPGLLPCLLRAETTGVRPCTQQHPNF